MNLSCFLKMKLIYSQYGKNTCGGFILIFGKTNTICKVKKKKKRVLFEAQTFFFKQTNKKTKQDIEKYRADFWNKKYSIYLKTDIQTHGTRQKAHKQTRAPMGTLFLTKEARIYNEAKTASSINGAVKTGQLHVKE